MWVIANTCDDSSAHRISNDIAGSARKVFISTQGVVMKAALPDWAADNPCHYSLETSDRFAEIPAVLQLHQPVHMIGHHNKSQRFSHTNHRCRMQRQHRPSCHEEFGKNR